MNKKPASPAAVAASLDIPREEVVLFLAFAPFSTKENKVQVRRVLYERRKSMLFAIDRDEAQKRAALRGPNWSDDWNKPAKTTSREVSLPARRSRGTPARGRAPSPARSALQQRLKSFFMSFFAFLLRRFAAFHAQRMRRPAAALMLFFVFFLRFAMTCSLLGW